MTAGARGLVILIRSYPFVITGSVCVGASNYILVLQDDLKGSFLVHISGTEYICYAILPRAAQTLSVMIATNMNVLRSK